jgi:hypothetical protein
VASPPQSREGELMALIRSGRNRCVDVYEAVKYDVRLHGARFITLEFAAAALIAGALAIFEVVRAAASGASVPMALWFAGFALNSLAVVLLARTAGRDGTEARVSQRWLHLYALELIVMLLLPGAVALVALLQRRADEG